MPLPHSDTNTKVQAMLKARGIEQAKPKSTLCKHAVRTVLIQETRPCRGYRCDCRNPKNDMAESLRAVYNTRFCGSGQWCQWYEVEDETTVDAGAVSRDRVSA